MNLFRLSNSTGSTAVGLVNWTQPATYIAFRGGTLSSGLTVGADSNAIYYGWPLQLAKVR